MPKRSHRTTISASTKRRVVEQDYYKCVRCQTPVTLSTARLYTPSAQPEKRRTLCKRCDVLRVEGLHRGMIAQALEEGIIPANWRELVWDG